MKVTDIIIFIIGSALMLFIQLLTYKQLTKNKTEISCKMIILSLLGGILVTYNAYINVNALRAYISFGILLILEIILYRDFVTKTIIYGVICYIIATFTEIFFEIFLFATNIIDLKMLDENIIARSIISILIILPAYFISKSSYFQNKIQKLTEFFEKSRMFLYITIISLVATLVIAFKNISSVTYSNYISNIILLVIFAIFLFNVIYNEQKILKEMDKAKVLLDFMSKYEKKIDEDRINKHEMLNNLLILKSYSNKNSEVFNDTLDDLIKTYSKKSIGVKNIYKLPSGLKGIIYYKINETKNKKLNISIHISKQITNFLEKLDSHTYTIICKIVGITFDNAIEASEKSKDKLINFDVYEEENDIIIEIANTYANNIDLKKMNKKNYSTKGSGRGLGLYIVKSLIRNNRNIKMIQTKEEKLFITKIYIKNLDIE